MNDVLPEQNVSQSSLPLSVRVYVGSYTTVPHQPLQVSKALSGAHQTLTQCESNSSVLAHKCIYQVEKVTQAFFSLRHQERHSERLPAVLRPPSSRLSVYRSHGRYLLHNLRLAKNTLGSSLIHRDGPAAQYAAWALGLCTAPDPAVWTSHTDSAVCSSSLLCSYKKIERLTFKPLHFTAVNSTHSLLHGNKEVPVIVGKCQRYSSSVT